MPKLTLSIDNRTVKEAKELAKRNNTSVSAMFSRFIKSLSSGQQNRIKTGPLTRKATGSISFEGKDYKDTVSKALTEKYGL